MIDAKAFGAELADIVKAATAPLLSQIEAMGARFDALERRIDSLPVPQDGKDADATEIAAIVRDQIKADLDAIRGAIPELPELPDIAAMVDAAVQIAVESLPAPQDGKSVTLADVSPLIADAVSKAVSALPVAKDGTGLAGALIDRDGNLVITLTNGEVQKLGVVVGKDADPAEPGRDGLGFEDLDFEADEYGRVTAKFQRGDVVKSVRLPGIVDRGPFKAGDGYEKGDAVSYGGSLWIAQEPTGEKPDGSKAWRLAVKKGRDARGA